MSQQGPVLRVGRAPSTHSQAKASQAPRVARDIWQQQSSISRQLLLWAALNLVGGLALQGSRDKAMRAAGQQAFGWGLINAAIALIGSRAAAYRQERPDAQSPETLSRETRNLRRALGINAALDVGYVGVGGWMASSADPARRGHGLGVMIQGLFLFFFDLIHFRRLS